MYKITMNDGTTIEGLRLKNNILWSDEPLTAEMFAGKLNPVIISGDSSEDESPDYDGLVGSHPHMGVAYIRQEKGKYALALYDIPHEKWENEKRDANIAYIAMMTGVEL